MTGALRLEAPAKLNLSLSVVRKRDDGYHELDSVLVLLELADQLLLLPGCSGLRVDGAAAAGVPLDADNLAWRGLVAGLDGEPDLACLTLEKRIPGAAGMGGGSSDAAAAWRLGRAWRGLPEAASSDELATLARIGADVPFFAARAPAARVTGIGERIAPLDLPQRHVVLAHPPFGLSTAEVFAELRADEWGRAENDLIGAAVRLRPELRDAIDLVAAAGGEPRMTGSGPTLFCLAEDAERAEAVAAGIRDGGMGATTTRTRRAAASIEPISGDEEEM